MPVPKSKQKLTHVFEWPRLNDLTLDEAHEYHVVKGVLMVEGELKSGEMMTADNVLQGGGALRASAMLGFADVDVDHHEHELPAEYEKKYGKEINDVYPVGFVIDCETVKNSDGKYEVQALMVITNDTVYDLIDQGKVKGNSVVDYYRDLKCEGDGDTGTCAFEGSSFMINTLVLDEVPNSESTWVAPIDEDDLGTIIVAAENAKHKHSASTKKLNAWISQVKQNKKTKKNRKPQAVQTESEDGKQLNDYMDDDNYWIDGRDGIVAYLMEVKGLDQTTAEQMADYLIEHPDILNRHQYEYLSGADLFAWWSHAKLETLEKKYDKLEKRLESQINNMHMLMHSNPKIKANVMKWSKIRANAKKRAEQL